MVSVRGRAQRATAGHSGLLIRPPRVAHIPRYFLYVQVPLLIMLIRILLRYSILDQLVNLQLANFDRLQTRTLVLHD